MLVALLRPFTAICCFRKGPQDLPASPELLSLCLLGYGFSSFLLAVTSQEPDIAIATALIDTLLLALLCYVLLLLRRLPGRWLQATTALSGIGIIFSLAAVPMSFWLANIERDNALLLPVFLIVILLLVWNIAVMAHIMRHALSTSFTLGLLAALSFVWIITATISTVLPQSPIT